MSDLEIPDPSRLLPLPHRAPPPPCSSPPRKSSTSCIPLRNARMPRRYLDLDTTPAPTHLHPPSHHEATLPSPLQFASQHPSPSPTCRYHQCAVVSQIPSAQTQPATGTTSSSPPLSRVVTSGLHPSPFWQNPANPSRSFPTSLTHPDPPAPHHVQSTPRLSPSWFCPARLLVPRSPP